MLLIFARIVFGVVGVVALLAGIGQLTAVFSPGNQFDPLPIVWALGLGVGALAAAAWVGSSGRLRAVAAWAGLGAMVATSLWPVYYLVTDPAAGPDVIALATIPSLIGLTASLVVARAHWRAQPAD